MSETSQYMNEVLFNIQRGQQMSNNLLFVARAGAVAVLQIYQFLLRLQKDHILKGGEVEKFEKWMKATGGDYDILNIPYQSGKDAPSEARQLSAIQKSLDEMGIRYHMLPDLDTADGAFQVCIIRKDKQKFGVFMGNYLEQHLSGREMEAANLISLSEKRASIVSVPCEGMADQIRGDFDILKVNYTMLPDLHVGDGYLQMIVANADMPKVRHWYGLYRDSLIHAGQKNIPEMKSMSLENYRNTASLSAEGYMDTAPQEIAEQAQKYDNEVSGPAEEGLQKTEQRIRDAQEPEYLRYLENPEYTRLSIDHETLVEKSRAGIITAADPSVFCCRLPQTYGDGENLLVLPKQQVFVMSDAERKRYIAFVRRDTEPLILNKDGKPLQKFKNGEELYQYFDQVNSSFKNRRMSQLAEKAATLTPTIPKMPVQNL